MSTLGDSMESASAIQSSFREFSNPQIPRCSQVDSYFLKELIHASINGDDDSDVNRDITEQEVISAVMKSSNSSPGPDGIGYCIFKKFQKTGFSLLTQWFNMCFSFGVFPSKFKSSLQYSLPKSTRGEFRPTTLSNAVVRIIERLIYKRINPYLDDLLPSWQLGFRSKRGASDQLLHLVSVLQDKKASGVQSGILYLDIKKAFDRVDTRTLICDLHSHGLRGRTLFAIQNILSDRFVRVLYKDHVLCNFYFRKVAEAAEKCSSKPSLLGFADDVAIVVHGTSD